MNIKPKGGLHDIGTSEFEEVCAKGTSTVSKQPPGDRVMEFDMTQKIDTYGYHFEDSGSVLDEEVRGDLRKIEVILQRMLKPDVLKNTFPIKNEIESILVKIKNIEDGDLNYEILLRQIVIQTRGLIVTLRNNFKESEKGNRFGVKLRPAIQSIALFLGFDEQGYF